MVRDKYSILFKVCFFNDLHGDLECVEALGVFTPGNDKKIARINRLRLRLPAKRVRSIAIARTGHLADARDNESGMKTLAIRPQYTSGVFHNDIY
jgi:hypothetical protein